MYTALPPPHVANAAQVVDINNHTQDVSTLDLSDPTVSDQGEQPSSYQYGLPRSAPRDSNFISDGDLLVWLAQRQDGMYADLRELMDISRERSKLIQDLGQIKALVDAGAETEEIGAALTALQEGYANTDYADLIVEALDGFIDFDHWALEPFDDGTQTELGQDLQGLMDALGRDDQLALIRIQSLTSDIREVAQLVSNLMSSSAQAAGTIVGNLRA